MEKRRREESVETLCGRANREREREFKKTKATREEERSRGCASKQDTVTCIYTERSREEREQDGYRERVIRGEGEKATE